MKMSQTSPFEPLRREKLSETVAAKLREQITEGHLKPGERLPGHRDLAEAFSVGMSSVREAISVLASEGMVETRAGRGTFVREATGRTITLSGSDELTQREVEEAIEAREALELQLAAMAAERASAADVADMRRHLQEMEATSHDPEAFAEADLEFHLAVARGAKNRFLLQAMEQIGNLMRKSMEISASVSLQYEQNIQLVLGSHRELIDQIEAAEPEASRRVVLEIIERHHENVLGPDPKSPAGG